MDDSEKRRAIQMMIQRVLDDAPFSMRQIAEEAGVSYDAVRSWATNRRTPKPENLVQLADALRRRGDQLHAIGDELKMIAVREPDTRD
jgi:transcriptional regulator with XRE-family HTH domain